MWRERFKKVENAAAVILKMMLPAEARFRRLDASERMKSREREASNSETVLSSDKKGYRVSLPEPGYTPIYGA